MFKFYLLVAKVAILFCLGFVIGNSGNEIILNGD